tara:strand:- start:142 stop:486 length:345 start_codon:yes stop_codon:yes gene_type:complete
MADPTYTYTWGFQDLDPIGRNASDPDKDLVTVIHWKLTATSSDGLSAKRVGFITLTKGDTVIPFEDLTKDNLLSWVKNSLGSSAVVDAETELKNNIIEQRTPATVFGTPSSWSS